MHWETPKDFYGRLDMEFGFTLDACADPINHKCEQFFTEADDGLSQTWNGTVWLNPPYDRTVYRWIQKAYQEAQNGCTVVCLVQAKTDTKWWHQFVMRANEVRFVRDRLYFNSGSKTGRAPFGVAVVIFRPSVSETVFTSMGA